MQEKRIKKWKGFMDEVQTAQYLHDMAAEGLILDDVGYLFYSFQEEEPQDLCYRVRHLENGASDAALAAMAAEGWQVVDHWELEYIFVKERQSGEEEVDEREIQEALAQKMQQKKKSIKHSFWLTAGMILTFAVLGIASFGFSKMGKAYLGRMLMILLLPFFVGLLPAVWHLRQLKKQQRMAEKGELFYTERDWRLRQKVNIIGLGLGILLLVGAIYYKSGMNEKEFALPKEISYAEVPAARLERIEEGDLLWVGDSIEEEKKFQAQLYAGVPKTLERMDYDNYGVDYRSIFPLRKRVETDQRMRHRDTREEPALRTEYFEYDLEILAKQEYEKALNWEAERLPQMLPKMTPSTILDIPVGAFDELHVCEKYYGEERTIHILCRKGGQFMELDYSGEAKIESILREAEAVFAAQA